MAGDGGNTAGDGQKNGRRRAEKRQAKGINTAGETWQATAEKGRAMGGSTARQQAMGETRQATGRTTAGDGGKKAGRWAEARHATAGDGGITARDAGKKQGDGRKHGTRRQAHRGTRRKRRFADYALESPRVWIHFPSSCCHDHELRGDSRGTCRFDG